MAKEKENINSKKFYDSNAIVADNGNSILNVDVPEHHLSLVQKSLHPRLDSPMSSLPTNVNYQNNEGDTALHLAVRGEL